MPINAAEQDEFPNKEHSKAGSGGFSASIPRQAFT
jgi:hypothetical protein